MSDSQLITGSILFPVDEKAAGEIHVDVRDGLIQIREAVIGHYGKQYEELVEDLQDVEDKFEVLTVQDVDSAQFAVDLAKEAREVGKRATALFKPFLDLQNTAIKAVRDRRMYIEAVCKKIKNQSNDRVLGWEREEEDKRLAAEAAIRRKAEETAKAEQAARAKALEEQERHDEAKRVRDTPPVPVIEAPAPISTPAKKVKGLQKRSTWDYRVIQESLVPDEFKVTSIDHKLLKKFVKTMGKNAARTPGIEIWEVQTGANV